MELKAVQILEKLKSKLEKESWLAKDELINNQIEEIDEAINELKTLEMAQKINYMD